MQYRCKICQTDDTVYAERKNDRVHIRKDHLVGGMMIKVTKNVRKQLDEQILPTRFVHPISTLGK